MKEKKWKGFGSRSIFFFLLLFFILISFFQGQSMMGIFRDIIQRVGMNGILTLALLPGILCGIGLNFGLSIGILCGLLGGCISLEWNLTGVTAFFTAICLSICFSIVGGFLYGLLLNRLPGSETTVSTYVGFSVVSLFSMGWTLLPFHHPEMVWAMGGKGLRTTISLEGRFAGVLDQWIGMGKEKGSIGTLLFFLLLCGGFFLFLHSKKGHMMRAAGENPAFAEAVGINVAQMKRLGTVLSTVLGGIGILVYSQAYGFMQLYQAPMMMPFSAVAAILIGGATVKKGNLSNVLIGVVFFQILISVSVPVINKALPNSTLGEPIRVLISYGVILYALVRGEENSDE